MTEHFTREEADTLATNWGVITTKFRTDNAQPYDSLEISTGRFKCALEAAVTAKQKEWEAQGADAYGVVPRYEDDDGYFDFTDSKDTADTLRQRGWTVTPLYTHALPAQPADLAKQVAALREGLGKIKLRLHFMGWPAESMWNIGTAKEPRWMPDWRYECHLIDHLLHGTPIDTPEKPTDTVAANTLPRQPAISVNEELVQELTLAASTLRSYEAQHRAKGTLESLSKAEVNNTLATRFEAALASAKALHPVGEVVVTWDEQQRRILAVTRQDDEGRILKVIAQAPKETLAEWAVQATPEEIDRADWRIAAAGLRKAIAELESSGCTRSDLRVYLAIAEDHGREPD